VKIFADTGAWIALADKNDRYHESAKNIYCSIQKRKIQLVITDYIFDETATWLHYKIDHKTACDWGNKILNSRMVDIVKVSEEHIDAGWKIFQKYHDQQFSFTDCVSFAVMNLLGIKEIFTYDSHFATMGFCVIGQLP
jgi:predicted nucleic acid-binding protein